jgi:hypothetical protein
MPGGATDRSSRCSALYPWAPVSTVGARPTEPQRYTLSQANTPLGSSCLSVGPEFHQPVDPWCLETSNMWRVNTDTLPVWGRVMTELEAMVGLGTVSR